MDRLLKSYLLNFKSGLHVHIFKTHGRSTRKSLNYAVRLRRGQSIGSGMVEGSIKQLLNKRMKQTGARWKTGHVGPFVELGALAHGPEWHDFWCNN